MPELGYKCLDVPFSAGDFKQVLPKKNRKKVRSGKEAEASEQLLRPRVPATTDQSTDGLFVCPQEGCVRVFQRLSNLEKHLSFENCVKSLERESLLDLAKTGYAARLHEGVGVFPTLIAEKPLLDGCDVQHVEPKEGWALKETKKPYRFSPKQRMFLEAKFNIGQTTGQKLNADAVAREMRRAVSEEGKRLFSISEFLSSQQISSFFSRLAMKLRKQQVLTADDVNAEKEELIFVTAREDILLSLQVHHPIMYEQHNLCTLVANRKLQELKLPILKLLCAAFDLYVEGEDRRKRRLFIDVIGQLFFDCSCKSKN